MHLYVLAEVPDRADPQERCEWLVMCELCSYSEGPFHEVTDARNRAHNHIFNKHIDLFTVNESSQAFIDAGIEPSVPSDDTSSCEVFRQTDGSWSYRCDCGVRGHNHPSSLRAQQFAEEHLNRVHHIEIPKRPYHD